jgi:hypothetical protein
MGSMGPDHGPHGGGAAPHQAEHQTRSRTPWPSPTRDQGPHGGGAAPDQWPHGPPPAPHHASITDPMTSIPSAHQSTVAEKSSPSPAHHQPIAARAAPQRYPSSTAAGRAARQQAEQHDRPRTAACCQHAQVHLSRQGTWPQGLVAREWRAWQGLVLSCWLGLDFESRQPSPFAKLEPRPWPLAMLRSVARPAVVL